MKPARMLMNPKKLPNHLPRSAETLKNLQKPINFRQKHIILVSGDFFRNSLYMFAETLKRSIKVYSQIYLFNSIKIYTFVA